MSPMHTLWKELYSFKIIDWANDFDIKYVNFSKEPLNFSDVLLQEIILKYRRHRNYYFEIIIFFAFYIYIYIKLSGLKIVFESVLVILNFGHLSIRVMCQFHK